jgi:hypothetical protein
MILDRANAIDVKPSSIKTSDGKPETDWLTGVKDLSEGLFHGAVENPVNGVVQLTNHLAGAHLPEMHLTNEQDDDTGAGRVGSFIGSTADMVALSLATGGLGSGAGIAVDGLRMAAVGAVVGGVLTPTDANSQTFFSDRIKNAAVTGIAFGAMGAAGSAIEAVASTEATVAARTLVANIGLNAVPGAAGGAAYAEANAVINQKRILPSAADFQTDVISYAALGAVMGAGATVIARPLMPERLGSTDDPTKQLKLFTDRTGSAVRIERLGYWATKGAGGEWNSKVALVDWDSVSAPPIHSVAREADGTVTIVSHEQGSIVNFGDGTFRNLTHEAAESKAAAKRAEIRRTADTVVYDDSGSQTYNYQGQLKGLNAGGNSAALSWKDNDIQHATLATASQHVDFSRDADGSYVVHTGLSAYRFEGTITPVSSQSGGALNDLEFKGPNSTFNFLSSRSGDFAAALIQNSTLLPGETGMPVISVSENGQTTIAVSSNFNHAIVNGEELKAGESVVVKPGDDVQLKQDVGDRYPVWQTQDLAWKTAADGTQQLGSAVLTANSSADLVP